MAQRQARDVAFLQWAGAGSLLGFGAGALPSIGAPFLLAGVVVLGVLSRRRPRWPAGLGALAGIGAVGVVVGAIGAVAGASVWLASGASTIVLAITLHTWLRGRQILGARRS